LKCSSQPTDSKNISLYDKFCKDLLNYCFQLCQSEDISKSVIEAVAVAKPLAETISYLQYAFGDIQDRIRLDSDVDRLPTIRNICLWSSASATILFVIPAPKFEKSDVAIDVFIESVSNGTVHTGHSYNIRIVKRSLIDTNISCVSSKQLHKNAEIFILLNNSMWLNKKFWIREVAKLVVSF